MINSNSNSNNINYQLHMILYSNIYIYYIYTQLCIQYHACIIYMAGKCISPKSPDKYGLHIRLQCITLYCNAIYMYDCTHINQTYTVYIYSIHIQYTYTVYIYSIHTYIHTHVEIQNTYRISFDSLFS